ncbi:hypothetical protein SDC9_71897 [bioreactor metagenome]|uniref:G domain-containing protein n=1 Tax=bioreactor metagenome TaxID=1076179 RepID=A0A644YFV5_9ZZZZ
MMESLPRIALVGAMGIGKTTALRSLCGDQMVSSDVVNLDRASNAKEFTTVGTEFGEIDLGDGERVQICGCPGQERFAFVRQWILSVSMGIFIMVDVNQPQALQEATRLLQDVAALEQTPVVLILNARAAPAARIDAFAAALTGAGLGVVPVLHADPRDRQQMLDAIGVLASMLSLQSEES